MMILQKKVTKPAHHPPFLGSPRGPCSCRMIAERWLTSHTQEFHLWENPTWILEFSHDSAKAAKVSAQKIPTLLEQQFFWESSWRKNAHTLDNTPCWIGNIWGTKSANSMTSRFRDFGVAPTHHVLFAKPFDVFHLFLQILGLNFVRIVKVVSFQYLGVFFLGGGPFGGVPFFCVWCFKICS